MFFGALGACLSRKNDDKKAQFDPEYEGGARIHDQSVGYGSNKYADRETKRGVKFVMSPDSLKGYTGLESDESDTEKKNKKSKFADDLRTPTTLNDSDLENGISDMKGKVYKKSDWIKILKNNDLENTSTTELYASLRQGIPFELRPQIWMFLAGVDKLKKTEGSISYWELANAECTNKEDEIQIGKDVDRTFSHNIFFTDKSYDGKARLTRILRAYVNYDPTIGYSQGMNSFCAALLVILHPENYSSSQLKFFETYEKDYEENTFWILVHLMKEKNWRSIYKKDFPKMFEMTKYLEKLIQTQLPEIHAAILASDSTIFDLFHEGFITFLMTYAPLAVGKRIVDLFLIDNEKLIFNVIIRALELNKKQIVSINSKYGMQNYIKREMFANLLEKYRKRLYVLFPFPDAENF
mmetsp:Transcript_21368/g.24832  ORF Transcript_21368/g.24832 Transcript_21368/m.24832 type:complete len:410 (+) Transcript_21368:41-1270(+)|eukprot:CAMPEP_0176428562 /NCGR_PEP_ID=MMETSP0127-20121128/13219_1 /TAXON_ID=938130 /ORGANISM="Platyophrya macrostoma, Strain WH" /LENGTH=409 /DNA_ID=CAMNT_0017810259 /DNA_START=40 /DNA_END=1269 /DNA_ORIENTATION=-